MTSLLVMNQHRNVTQIKKISKLISYLQETTFQLFVNNYLCWRTMTWLCLTDDSHQSFTLILGRDSIYPTIVDSLSMQSFMYLTNTVLTIYESVNNLWKCYFLNWVKKSTFDVHEQINRYSIQAFLAQTLLSSIRYTFLILKVFCNMWVWFRRAIYIHKKACQQVPWYVSHMTSREDKSHDTYPI